MLGLVHEQKEPVLKGKTDADEAEANSALCQLNLTLCIQGVRERASVWLRNLRTGAGLLLSVLSSYSRPCSWLYLLWIRIKEVMQADSFTLHLVRPTPVLDRWEPE